MLNCIIIEDQPPAQRILKRYVENVDGLKLKGVFPDVIKLEQLLKEEAIDLIFLDIDLPKMSGIDFLRSLKNSPKIILTTAFSDYALESYQYNVIDYLLKPISFERFLKAIDKVNSATSNNNENLKLNKEHLQKHETIFIKSGYDHIQLFVEDIMVIKADSDYTEIITSEKNYLSKQPLKHWTEKLNHNQFYQVHKSYVVNVASIEKISGNSIHLPSMMIPFGRTYKKDFMDKHLR